jgi:hypothetical protein
MSLRISESVVVVVVVVVVMVAAAVVAVVVVEVVIIRLKSLLFPCRVNSYKVSYRNSKV